MEGFIIPVGMLIISTFVGIVGYFLKRTINTVDDLRKEIDSLKTEQVSKSGLDRFEVSLKEDINAIKVEHKERIDKLVRDVEGIKEDYITKDDFFREQAKMERKLDRILDILLDGKGGGNYG